MAHGPTRVTGEIAAESALWQDSGLQLLEPLAVELTAQAGGDGIWLQGHLRTRLAQECRRCLEPVQQAVEVPVDLLFEPLQGEEAAELEGEVYAFAERDAEIDLRDALREQLLLAVPPYVVCAEDCRGLCPRCGANRNHTACDCADERDPGPWDALKNLQFD